RTRSGWGGSCSNSFIGTSMSASGPGVDRIAPGSRTQALTRPAWLVVATSLISASLASSSKVRLPSTESLSMLQLAGPQAPANQQNENALASRIVLVACMSISGAVIASSWRAALRLDKNQRGVGAPEAKRVVHDGADGCLPSLTAHQVHPLGCRIQ